jgi:starch-binding outer membrane protein, SusD/RagB family
MKNLKNKLYRLASLVPLFTLASSCDVLDQPPQSIVAMDEFYTSGSDAEIGLRGAYNRLFREAHIPATWMILDINSDDLTPREAAYFGHAWENRELMSPAQNANTDGQFTAPYVTIANSNLLIERVAEIPEGSFVGPTVSAAGNRKQEVLGEAHFIRAMSYYYLTMLWRNVPLILEFPQGALPADNQVPASTQEQVLAQVVRDLEVAIANLPNALTQFTPNVQRGRASKWAAKLLLSRIRLWERNWAEVDRLSNEIINSGRYNLVNPWTEIFLDGGNSQEAILEIQANRGPEFFMMGIQGWHYGNGGFRATEDALNTFETAPTPTGQMRDARLEHSIRYNENAANNRRVAKFMPEPLWAEAALEQQNLTVFRLAEVYFNKAEAMNELDYMGNRTEVLRLLNDIRARAGRQNFINRFRQNAPQGTTGIPLLTEADVPTQEAMRQAIREEKRRELMFEGTRWLDLLRWDPQYAMQIVGAETPDRLYFPIPEREIIVNDGVLAQNPGW